MLSIFISLLEAGKGNILQQPAQMPLQCSWTGIVLEFAFGIETVAASLSKIWRGCGKSRRHPTLEHAFGVVLCEFQQDWDSEMHSELLHSDTLYPVEFRSKNY